MGKILITNHKKWENDLRAVFASSGFVENTHISTLSNGLTVYKKLNVESINFFSDGKDYVASTGTLFYKGLFGINALKKILIDAKSKSISELRRETIGSYAVAIKTGETLRVFVDENATYFLYYYCNAEGYVVTNTYYHIQKMMNLPINGVKLLESITRCIIGNQSPAVGVYKLLGTQCIKIDLQTSTCEICCCEVNDYSDVFSSKEEAVDRLFQYMKGIIDTRSSSLKTCQLFLTGGIDSRLQLASHILGGDKVTISYWSGKDVITNGTTHDLEISKALAQKCDMPFIFYDVTERFSDAISNITDSRCQKYGEYSGIYAGNKKWFHIFENLTCVSSVNFGYSGEIIRDLAEIDRFYHKNYSLAEFIVDIYDRGGAAKTLYKLPGFYESVQSSFQNKYNNMDMENLTKEDCFRLFGDTRFTADCGINNLANMYVYTFPMFFSKQISDTVYSLPYEWLKDSTLSIKLLERMAVELLDVPIYSHHRTYYYKHGKSCIKKSLRFTVLDKMKPVIANTPLYTVLYLKYAHKYIRPQSVENDDILKECMRVLSCSGTLNSAGIELRQVESWKGLDVSAFAVNSAYVCIEDTVYGRPPKDSEE